MMHVLDEALERNTHKKVTRKRYRLAATKVRYSVLIDKDVVHSRVIGEQTS